MKRNQQISISLTIFFLCIFSATTSADICNQVGREDTFRVQDRQQHDYFDDFFIRKDSPLFYVRATKVVTCEYQKLVQLLDKFERHHHVMPSYKAMKIERQKDGRIYAGIRFQPDFSYFESRFTVEFEVSQTNGIYRQCWDQLPSDHPNIIEDYWFAPGLNRGYWYISKFEEKLTEIRYFAIIRPQIRLPLFLYRYIIQNTYKELFESLLLHDQMVHRPFLIE